MIKRKIIIIEEDVDSSKDNKLRFATEEEYNFLTLLNNARPWWKRSVPKWVKPGEVWS